MLIACRRLSWPCARGCSSGHPGLDSDGPEVSLETFVAFTPVCGVPLTVTWPHMAGLGQDSERELECVDGVAELGRPPGRRSK